MDDKWTLVQVKSWCCQAPSSYLNQCWNIVNSNIRNRLQWNSHNFVRENAFENVVCEMRPFCLGLNVLKPGHKYTRICFSVWGHHWFFGSCKGLLLLTHWGRVTHICVGSLTIIGSDNGLSPGRRQAIIWTNAGILLIGPLGTNFNGIVIGIQTFSVKKMSSGKWPQCVKLRRSAAHQNMTKIRNIPNGEIDKQSFCNLHPRLIFVYHLTHCRVPTRSLFPGKVLTFGHGSLGPGKVLSFSNSSKRSWKILIFLSRAGWWIVAWCKTFYQFNKQPIPKCTFCQFSFKI